MVHHSYRSRAFRRERRYVYDLLFDQDRSHERQRMGARRGGTKEEAGMLKTAMKTLGRR